MIDWQAIRGQVQPMADKVGISFSSHYSDCQAIPCGEVADFYLPRVSSQSALYFHG